MLCMPTSAGRVTRYFGLCVFVWVLAACSSATDIDVKGGETFAELRLIKGEAQVSADDQAPRNPYPRERLTQGQSVVLQPGALVWMRKDGGATWLISGPAELTLQATTIAAKHGRFFADTEQGEPVTLDTPRGPVTLRSARASVDVNQDGSVQVYALRGETRFGSTGHLTPGEELTWKSNAEPRVAPAVTWTDWTGGLAVTDNVAAPAPFGIGTVGARKPSEVGAPRFPLLIQRLDVNVTIEGDFALTEVDQTFVNPTTDTVEGLFSFRTPSGAMLQRFGVDRDFGLVWGRIKESAAAEAQYQANVYQGSSEEPALLAWQGQGVYAARLYPIPSRGKRRVVTRYSEWLPRNGEHGERRLYVYPMAAQGAKGSLPVIEELSVNVDLARANAKSVRVGSSAKLDGSHVVLRAADVVPRADLSLELFDEGGDGAIAYQAPHNLLPQDVPEGVDQSFASEVSKEEASYVAFPIRIPRYAPSGVEATQPDKTAANNGREAVGIDLAIVVDTSAATEPSALALARSLAGSMLSHLGSADRAALWTGDAVLHPVAPNAGDLTNVSPALQEAWLAGLAGVQLGGATDLGALIQAAASKLDPQRRGAVVYIGDGAPSVGELVPKALVERLARLPTGTRIFAAALGTEPNLPVLEAVTRGGVVFAVHDGQSAGSAALGILESAQRYTWLDSQLDLGPGVERVFPRVLPPLAEDSTLVVVGRLTGAVPSRITLTGSGGKLELPVTTHAFDDRGDLRRRWGHARFAELLDAGAGRAELVDVAQRSGVVTPVTSIYVATRREEASEAASEVQREDDYAAQRAKERRWQPWRSGGLADEVAEALDFTRSAPQLASAPVEVQASNADNKEGGSGSLPRYATRAKGEAGSMGATHAATPSLPTPPAAVVTPQSAKQEAPEQEAPEQQYAERSAMLQDKMSAASTRDDMDRLQAKLSSAKAAPAKARPSQGGASFDPLSGDLGGDWRDESATQPWSRDSSASADGMGLSGIGSGGGGTRNGIGLGSIGTLGHGAGTGNGNGFGAGHGRLGGSHATSSPKLRQGPVSVLGRLPKEVVQRIARQNFGRFRMCYETGLVRDPNLTGKVEVQFTIDSEGGVGSSKATTASTLPDPDVIACVSRTFYSLSFPSPDSDSVTVTFMLYLGDSVASPAVTLFRPTSGGVLGAVGHTRMPCGPGADLPFSERVGLWRERVQGGVSVSSSIELYANALRACEAPSFQERTRLLVLLVNNLGSVRDRVSLWRQFLELSPRAADVIYRSLLLRVQTPADLKELHVALGFKQIEPELLGRLLKQATDAAHKVRLLRGVAAQFPDDTELALQVLDAYEDAGDEAGGRSWARQLRRRADATSHVRTHIGEYYMRLAGRGQTPEAKQADTTEARRTFGELVEFAPNDPLARRQLGDLLRAHGWFEEAERQYETLLVLTPDDPAVPLLLAATAAGTGKTQEAITWLEKATATTSSEVTNPLFAASQAFASEYLARARLALAKADEKTNAEDAGAIERLRVRARRWLTSANSDLRVIVTWSHPELHPLLWTSQAGTMLLAPDNHGLLGVAQGYTSLQTPLFSLRLDPQDAARAARLGLHATVTTIVNEGQPDEKIASLDVAFGGGKVAREVYDYRWQDGALVEVTQ
jgi:tetratricopeptide (TPR) repeat protein